MSNAKIDISSMFGKSTKNHINNSRKETLFSELGSLLSSGLDFSRSFQLLIDTELNESVKNLLLSLFNDVIIGFSLWESLQKSNHFTALDVGVIRIGEQTGRLDESLRFLSEYYSKKVEQKRMISSAVNYPLVILITAIIVVIFMLLVIVPMFEQVYSRMGGELPTLTKWIIAFSKSFPTYFTAFALIVISGGILIYTFRERDEVRRVLASITLNTPIVGEILKKNSQTHFCKLLYLLIASGVPLLTSIEMLRSIITLYPYQQSFATITQGLCRGELFSTNLTKFPKLYGKKMTTLLTVGEQTNRLPAMLRRQGDELTKELEFRIRQLGTILEPVLILLVGCLVAVVLISMYLPMFKLGGIIN